MNSDMITLMKRTIVSILLTVFLVSPFSVVAQNNDKEAPEINNVIIDSVSDTSVTVTWETDEEADSTINYGLQPDYGIVRIPVADPH